MNCTVGEDDPAALRSQVGTGEGSGVSAGPGRQHALQEQGMDCWPGLMTLPDLCTLSTHRLLSSNTTRS